MCSCGEPQLSCSQSLVRGGVAMGEREGGVISNADELAAESELDCGCTQVYMHTAGPHTHKVQLIISMNSTQTCVIRS